jgi:cytochrome c biogenesis protein CcmG, thiol:disulfide interchange protein DsbE
MSSSGATEPASPGEKTTDASPGGRADPDHPNPRAGEQARRRPRPIFLVVGIVLAVALGIGLFTGVGTGGSKGSGNGATSGRPTVGDPVPGFSLPRLGGGAAVSVPGDGGGHGRPAVLLFFASWCGPCQTEIPALATALRHHPTTVAVIGIDGSDPTANALTFDRRSGVSFPVGADRSFSVTEGLFDFSGLPEAVFVRRDGTVVGVLYGALSAASLSHWEQKLSA